MSNTRRVAPPRAPKLPTPDAPLAGLTQTVIDTEDGPKRALMVEGTEPLPAPGAARDDVLKERGDSLAERMALVESALGIDSSASPQKGLRDRPVDREIARVYDHTAVHNAPCLGDGSPEFAYYWANERSAHGIDVTLHKTDGWQVVSGDMPENLDDRDVRGYRIIGDVLLMRLPMPKFLILRERDAMRREHRKQSVTSALEMMGHNMRGRIRVTNLSDFQLQRAAKQAAAETLATSITESRLRNGNIPGLTPGR